ncbi:hypothetical protein HYS47_02640 [Candidatus Woesearchaeota archaeon]|nr:hypothetical protein [Candidatus Woesearchaeota archaeon]
MAQADVQHEILDTLTGLKNEVSHLKNDMHRIIGYLEDARLTEQERSLLDDRLSKIKRGDESDFISHERLKQELGL